MCATNDRVNVVCFETTGNDPFFETPGLEMEDYGEHRTAAADPTTGPGRV